jgi:hypothetical protein
MFVFPLPSTCIGWLGNGYFFFCWSWCEACVCRSLSFEEDEDRRESPLLWERYPDYSLRISWINMNGTILLPFRRVRCPGQQVVSAYTSA